MTEAASPDGAGSVGSGLVQLGLDTGQSGCCCGSRVGGQGGGWVGGAAVYLRVGGCRQAACAAVGSAGMGAVGRVGVSCLHSFSALEHAAGAPHRSQTIMMQPSMYPVVGPWLFLSVVGVAEVGSNGWLGPLRHVMWYCSVQLSSGTRQQPVAAHGAQQQQQVRRGSWPACQATQIRGARGCSCCYTQQTWAMAAHWLLPHAVVQLGPVTGTRLHDIGEPAEAGGAGGGHSADTCPAAAGCVLQLGWCCHQ